MGDIIITDTATVKVESENLASNAVQLESVKVTIENALNETKAAWEQSQADAQTFTQGLTDDIQFLEEVIACNKDFANAIQNYMEATEKTAAQTA